jgi:2-methylcitrate dehydratase PrpD
MEHIVATTLVHGHADVAAFAAAALHDRAVAALRDKVRLAPYARELAPPNDRPARVGIRLGNGRTIERECLSAPGGPDRPFSDALVMDKVERLTREVYPRFAPLMARLVGLDAQLLERSWGDVVDEFTT